VKIAHAVSLAATFVALSLTLQQPPQSAPETQATEPARPNVLVIMTDDQDVDGLPVMRRLMTYPEGSWIQFNNAFNNEALCAPSRATLLTGQYSHHHRVTTNALGNQMDDRNTLAVWLDSAGYKTALIGKYHLATNRPSRYVPPGWDIYRKSKLANEADARSQAGVDYIRSTIGPWFLWLSYYAPHAVADPPARYVNSTVFVPDVHPNVNEADVSDKPAWVRKFPLLSAATLQKWRREQVNAQRETMAIDDGVANIVTALKDTGQLNNTLIIFVGDHGISWGSHRKIGKWCPYEECIRMPLLIRYPGTTGNRVETRYVSNVDLAKTILEFTGVTTSSPLDGRSLIPLLNDTASQWRNSVLLERHIADDYFGVRVPGWKYLEYESGYRELYDLTADPWEMQNIARNPAYASKMAELAAELDELLGH